MVRPDRDQDWQPRLASLAQTSTREHKPELQALQRAALAASQVTGDEDWDLLLSIINKRIEDLQKQKESYVDRLLNSDNFTTEDLIDEKLAVRLLGREIEALTWVIELPKDIMEKGDYSKQLLESIDKSSD